MKPAASLKNKAAKQIALFGGSAVINPINSQTGPNNRHHMIVSGGID